MEELKQSREKETNLRENNCEIVMIEEEESLVTGDKII